MAILKIKNENGEFINIPSIKGEKGDGIPKGGTNGQVLRKTTDSTEWADINIPSKTSELTNDSGFITEIPNEEDPTIPNHVKGITEEDIANWNNKAEKEDIPVIIVVEGLITILAGETMGYVEINFPEGFNLTNTLVISKSYEYEAGTGYSVVHTPTIGVNLVEVEGKESIQAVLGLDNPMDNDFTYHIKIGLLKIS